MENTALSIIAIAVFSITLCSLLGPLFHLSPTIPALITVCLMGLVSIDTLSLENRGATLLLDLFNSQKQKERILHHEAGHFLTAYYLDLPITGYTLSAWEAFKQGQGGNGGVMLDTDKINELFNNPTQKSLIIDRLCTLWMAGIAAENLIYGNTEGGSSDRKQLQITLEQAGLSNINYVQKQRWGQLQASNLITKYRQQYDNLVIAMSERKTVEECCEILKLYTL